MKPERFGELVAQLWRVVESGEPEGCETALRELRASVFIAVNKKLKQGTAKQAA
jgi:hypothetical protein